MEKDNREFSPQQSLQLIQSMIEKAKHNIASNRFYFLLWGWVAFIGFSGQFLLKVVFNYEHHNYVWFLTFVAAGVSIWYSAKKKKAKMVKTYPEENMSNLWLGMGLSFFVLSLLFYKIGWENSYPFFILMYGLGTFVSGRILKFRPLIIGGLVNLVLAGASVWFSFDYQLIFAAVSILLSYIIPGYMLKEESQ